MGYIREGFASIQNAVSMSFIRLITNKTQADFPEIYVNRFPSFRRIYDDVLYYQKLSLSMIILLGFSFPASTLLMVSEKKNL